jgi:hypothetical protein
VVGGEGTYLSLLGEVLDDGIHGQRQLDEQVTVQVGVGCTQREEGSRGRRGSEEACIRAWGGGEWCR